MNDSGDPYVYPGTFVLRNRLGITDTVFLDKRERALVVLRSRRGVPRGDFELAHLRAIHRHLFQDIYDWAGELRTVEIRKGDQQFQFRQYIPTGMGGCSPPACSVALPERAPAGRFVGDINYIHPFRQGNGRTQRQYFKQLAGKAGHRLDLARIDGPRRIEASVSSHATDYARWPSSSGKPLCRAANGR